MTVNGLMIFYGVLFSILRAVPSVLSVTDIFVGLLGEQKYRSRAFIDARLIITLFLSLSEELFQTPLERNQPYSFTDSHPAQILDIVLSIFVSLNSRGSFKFEIAYQRS